jgi:hypothetical protein
MEMKLWCFDDAHYWGTSLAEAAQKRGHEVALFDTVKEVGQEGILFYHMHHHPAVRDHHKRAMAQFATIPGLKLIPSYRTSVLYDDRIEQLREFGAYMPKTVVLRSPRMAHAYLDAGPDHLPIVSKSHIGPGTRTLATIDEARKEIKHAFSDIGIKNRYGVYHHGTLYWQQNVENTEKTFRVLIIGTQAMVEVREGQRLIAIVEETEETRNVVAFARMIAMMHGIHFAGFDFIRNGSSWYLMKIIAGWSLRRYVNARFFPDGRTGAEFWEVMVDQMEQRNL